MPYFKKEKHTASDTGDKYWIYHPTVYKTGKNVVFIKGKTDKTFVTKRRS